MKTLYFLFFLGTIICSSCMNGIANSNSHDFKLPDLEIVYFIQSEDKGSEIGFINSDGTDKIELIVKYKKGLFFDNNFITYYETIPSPPFAWNRKLKILGLVNRSKQLRAGYPILINEQGNVLECPRITSPWTATNYFIQDEFRIIVVDEGYPPKQELVLFNMKSCDREKVLYKNSNDEEILSFSILPDKKIAISKKISTNAGVKYRTDLFSNDFQMYGSIIDAKDFSWASNGMRFFYYDTSKEINVICEDLDISCREDSMDYVAYSWSSAGNSIIYYKGGKIFAKGIINQKMKYLVDGSFPITEIR